MQSSQAQQGEQHEKHLMHILEELLFLLVVQGVRMGYIVQSFLGFQGWEHNLILSL